MFGVENYMQNAAKKRDLFSSLIFLFFTTRGGCPSLLFGEEIAKIGPKGDSPDQRWTGGLVLKTIELKQTDNINNE